MKDDQATAQETAETLSEKGKRLNPQLHQRGVGQFGEVWTVFEISKVVGFVKVRFNQKLFGGLV